MTNPLPAYTAENIAAGVRYLYDPKGRIVAEIISDASPAAAEDEGGIYINEAEAAQAATLFQAAPAMLAALREALTALEDAKRGDPIAAIANARHAIAQAEGA